ncbi:MAG: hypothetical protein PHC64_06265 [Candidatus Gastranaerophilales bacterium]|nr:hypothetical protein [Candidatus Gastranaerophilales bacterium]
MSIRKAFNIIAKSVLSGAELNSALTDYATKDDLTTGLATKEPLKGSDDNYVTDAQLTILSNTSGTNTGDETASTIQTKLGVSSSNITALASLSGTNTGDQDLSGLANVSLSNINSTAQSTLKTICGAIPTSSSGIGQVYTVVGENGAAVSTPSGGTWVILNTIQVYNSDAKAYYFTADITSSAIVSGGTQIIAARSGYSGAARLWRVA